MAKIVQTEGRTSSLLECYAEVQPIFCKDTKKIETTIPFNSIFLFSTQRLSIRGGSYPHSALPLARARTAATEQTCTNITILPRNTQNTQKRQVGRLSHRLHGYAQIRRVWHPCHTHAATKLSSHRIHGTHRNDWRGRKICVHLCNLWEALTCQNVLWVLRVLWENILRQKFL